MSQLDEFNQNNILFKRYRVINTLIEDQPSNDYTAEGKSALENVFNDDIFTSVIPRDLSAAYYLDSLANDTNGAPNLPDTSANCWDTGIYSELTSLYDASNNIVPHLSFFKRVPLKTVSAQSPNAWWLIDPSSSTAELTTQNLLKHMIPFSYGSRQQCISRLFTCIMVRNQALQLKQSSLQTTQIIGSRKIHRMNFLYIGV